MTLSPIILFVYNRPWHTQQTLEALQKNELASESEIFIYSDAPNNDEAKSSVLEVRELIKKVTGFKKVTVIERDKNWGLAASIIDGVTAIINQYGKIIVLEDDLVTSPYFLKFMNDSLSIFSERQDIFSITGFNYPETILNIPSDYNEDIYLSYRAMSWSWGTWKYRWEGIDWEIKDYKQFSNNKSEIELFNRGGEDLSPMLKSQLEGKIDSWAIRFCYAHYKNNAFCVYPVKSFVNNNGFDGTGVHCGKDDTGRLANLSLNISEIDINKDVIVSEIIINRFFKISKRSLLRKIKAWVVSFI